jgi:co-chaperonin GroES (HSP10)
MIKPLPNRVLVKLLPRWKAIEDSLHLILVDKKKHYEGARRGEVLSVGDFVVEVKVGEKVWFHGAMGKSFDKDSDGQVTDGVGLRVLRVRDILCVEHPVEEVAA